MTAISVVRTQEDTIRQHLSDGKPITPAHAFMVYGISRLSAVIQNLRLAGMNISTVMKADEMGRKYGEYKLAGPIKIGSMVTVKAGHGYGMPSWVRRSKPAKVTGMIDDCAYVYFQRAHRFTTVPLNIKELTHVS